MSLTLCSCPGYMQKIKNHVGVIDLKTNYMSKKCFIGCTVNVRPKNIEIKLGG